MRKAINLSDFYALMETLLSALATLYANTDREQKLQANNYLEEFQKSVSQSEI